LAILQKQIIGLRAGPVLDNEKSQIRISDAILGGLVRNRSIFDPCSVLARRSNPTPTPPGAAGFFLRQVSTAKRHLHSLLILQLVV
jgi:hypothetical protein